MGVLGRPCKEHDDVYAAAANNNFLGFTLGKMKIISCFYRRNSITYLKSLSCLYYYIYLPFFYISKSIIVLNLDVWMRFCSRCTLHLRQDIQFWKKYYRHFNKIRVYKNADSTYLLNLKPTFNILNIFISLFLTIFCLFKKVLDSLKKAWFVVLKHCMCSKHLIFFKMHSKNDFDHLRGIYNVLQCHITNFLQKFITVAKQTSVFKSLNVNFWFRYQTNSFPRLYYDSYNVLHI